MIREYLGVLKAALLKEPTVSYLPRFLQIDVSTCCNLHCAMCEANKVLQDDEQKRHFGFDDFVHLVDTLRPLSVNLAASGEPFLNPEIFKMIAHARQRGIETIVSTNFILPEATIREIALNGPDIVKISIDGATKETYERIRGPHFEKLIGNIGFFREQAGSAGAKAPPVRFNFVIMKTNYHEIAEFIDFVHRFGIGHVYYYAIDTREYGDERMQELVYGVDLQRLKQLLREAQRRAAKYGIRTNIGNLLRSFDRVTNIYSGNRGAEKLRRCIVPWLGLFVSVKGQTSPCCIIYPDEKNSLGNILTEGPGGIWNGEKMRGLRECFKKGTNYTVYEGCRHCIPMDFNNIARAGSTFPGYIRRLLLGK